MAVEQPLATIGTFTCYADWVVTPTGTHPIAGTQWTVVDNTRTEKYRPAWVIVLAIIGALFCLVGLLLLLITRARTAGYLEVVVSGHGFREAAQIPMPANANPAEAAARIGDIHARVDYARRLAADAAARQL